MGLTVAPHSYLYSFRILEHQHLFSDTESLLADVDSCDEDGEKADEGVVEEELAEIPGTTKGT